MAFKSRSFSRVRRHNLGKPSSTSRAITAFQGATADVTSHQVGFVKVGYGNKGNIFIPHDNPDFLGNVVIPVASDITHNATQSQLGAFRNHNKTIILRSHITYEMYVRVSRWVCRQNVPLSVGGGALGSISDFYNYCWNAQVDVPTQPGNALTANSIEATPFQNKLWCQTMRCVSMKKKLLMPLGTMRWSMKSHIRVPATAYTYTNGDFGTYLGTHRYGGVTSFFDLIETWGNLYNDATASPGTPALVYAPAIYSVTTSERCEIATMPGPIQLYSNDEGLQPVVTGLVQIDPSNLSATVFSGKSTWNGGLNANGI